MISINLLIHRHTLARDREIKLRNVYCVSTFFSAMSFTTLFCGRLNCCKKIPPYRMIKLCSSRVRDIESNFCFTCRNSDSIINCSNSDHTKEGRKKNNKNFIAKTTPTSWLGRVIST
jgi:hypothetical protein